MANVLPIESEDESDAADSVSPVELFFAPAPFSGGPDSTDGVEAYIRRLPVGNLRPYALRTGVVAIVRFVRYKIRWRGKMVWGRCRPMLK